MIQSGTRVFFFFLVGGCCERMKENVGSQFFPTMQILFFGKSLGRWIFIRVVIGF